MAYSIRSAFGLKFCTLGHSPMKDQALNGDMNSSTQYPVAGKTSRNLLERHTSRGPQKMENNNSASNEVMVNPAANPERAQKTEQSRLQRTLAAMGELFRRLGEFVAGLVVVEVILYFALLGYFSAACSRDGAVWALIMLLFFPVAFPFFGLLLLTAATAIGLWGRPFHAETKFWRWAIWLPLLAPLTGFATWLAAYAAHAHDICSFGF